MKQSESPTGVGRSRGGGAGGGGRGKSGSGGAGGRDGATGVLEAKALEEAAPAVAAVAAEAAAQAEDAVAGPSGPPEDPDDPPRGRRLFKGLRVGGAKLAKKIRDGSTKAAKAVRDGSAKGARAMRDGSIKAAKALRRSLSAPVTDGTLPPPEPAKTEETELGRVMEALDLLTKRPLKAVKRSSVRQAAVRVHWLEESWRAMEEVMEGKALWALLIHSKGPVPLQGTKQGSVQVGASEVRHVRVASLHRSREELPEEAVRDLAQTLRDPDHMLALVGTGTEAEPSTALFRVWEDDDDWDSCAVQLLHRFPALKGTDYVVVEDVAAQLDLHKALLSL